MAEFNTAVMTEEGARLLTDCMMGKAKIEFYSIVAGDGVYEDGEDIEKRTGLKNKIQEIFPSSIEKIDRNSVCIRGLFTNAELTKGYYVREMGLYAKNTMEPDEPPVLYSVVVASAPDYFPPYNGKTENTIIQEYYAAVSNSAEVTITTSASALALAEDLNRHMQEADIHKHLILTDIELPVSERLENSLYALITDRQTFTVNTKISPHLSVRVVD